MQHEMKHTKEPWRREDFAGGGRKYCALSGYGGKHVTDYVAKEDADRAVACVNALAGIADPAAFVTRAKAIEEAVCNAQTWLEAPPITGSDKLAARSSLVALRAALALPGGDS